MRKRKKKKKEILTVTQRAKFLGHSLPKGVQQQDILVPLKIFLKKETVTNTEIVLLLG